MNLISTGAVWPRIWGTGPPFNASLRISNNLHHALSVTSTCLSGKGGKADHQSQQQGDVGESHQMLDMGGFESFWWGALGRWPQRVETGTSQSVCFSWSRGVGAKK